MRVSVRVFELPATTFPKLRLVGFGVIWPCVTPTPDRGTVSVVLLASDVIVRLPLLLPADAGVNTALKVVLCPAFRLTGSVGPLKVNPVPVTAAFEIVTVEPPELVTTTATDLLLPSVTLPKTTLLGLAVNEPGATPVPLSAIFNGDPGASEAIARLPLTFPEPVGANFTEKITAWLGVNVVGSVNPTMEKPAPVTVACEMVTFDPPELVRVSDRLELLPTCTLPKARLAGLDESAPGVAPFPDNAMFRFGLPPFEVMLMFPVTPPGAVGANVAENEIF